MTDPTAWLDQRQRLADEATPGPWESVEDDWTEKFGIDSGCGWMVVEGIISEDNAAFIADARTSVPAMVAALRAVLELHQIWYRSTSDEVWQRDSVCSECGDCYPCPTTRAITEALNGERHD